MKNYETEKIIKEAVKIYFNFSVTAKEAIEMAKKIHEGGTN